MAHQPPDSLNFEEPPDPELPEVASSGDSGARTLIAVVSFLITGVITFYAVVFAFMRFNTLPRDEMSQGIVGGFFAVVLAVPVAVLIGACTAVLATHAFDRLNGALEIGLRWRKTSSEFPGAWPRVHSRESVPTFTIPAR